MNFFIFGLGYSAKATVNLMGDWVLQNGGSISVTTRNNDKKNDIRARGLGAYIFDGSTASDLLRDNLNAATHLLTSISPPLEETEQDPVFEAFQDEIRANKNLKWIGYYSTVGVYGDHDGAWVDEGSLLKPVSRRSVARVKAENAWKDLASKLNIPLSIIRLAGIYGPGRNTFVNFQNGRARRIIKPGQVFNRIHVEDIARITRAAAMGEIDGVLNGSDDEPAPPQDVVEYAANLMGEPVPPGIPFEEANLSPMGRSFYGETKRVSNQLTKERLGIELKFPTYRTALDQMWARQNWANQPELRDFSR